MTEIDELVKIKLLLSSEYNALSNQIIARFNGQSQLYAMLSTITVGLLGAYFAKLISGWSLFGLLVFTALLGAWLWFDIDRDIAKAALRMREIEERVNKFSGEDLLVWESKKGRGGVIGKHFLPKPNLN